MELERVGMEIAVRGVVQGVGFRPFLYNLARRFGLTGWVLNTSAGVTLRVNGTPQAVEAFVHAIRAEAPPLARIDSLTTLPAALEEVDGFSIRASVAEAGAFMPVSPDVAICAACRNELFDPADRRFRYPFLNCTHCGPRFSIIKDLPYDRPSTTLADFPLCADCAGEYDDPADRRFHAQPVACPRCGPHLSFVDGQGRLLGEREAALQTARDWLADGKIVAVKGLGGYHLACDAANAAAVETLRARKKRSDKPFALMAFDLDALRRECAVSEAEAELLSSRAAPIVLLTRRTDGAGAVCAAVAPGQNTLGCMLPSTPLHLLLLEAAAEFPPVLVMTSGNISEEPIAYEDEDARTRLAGLADGFLLHDRPIHMRVDDSVVVETVRGAAMVRRARGYAPDTTALPFDLPPTLATGAELKNTFALSRERYAFVSHHIGDLENMETLRSFETGIAHYERLFRVTPERIACDLHPDYLATRYAEERARREGLPLRRVQHHHAHLAACLADNGWDTDAPVLGLIFDGTGYGTDGAIWGGEALFGGYAQFERLAHLAYVPLAGGDASTRKPARMALAHLAAADVAWSDDLPPVQALDARELAVLRAQLANPSTPATSSMGRLFDAAAALMGIRQVVSYEAQAAIEMEALAQTNDRRAYPFALCKGTDGILIEPRWVWLGLIDDLRAGVSQATMAARFINGVAQLCLSLAQTAEVETVALSGGVWQNRRLLAGTLPLLERAGLRVLTHRAFPTNDGGIALGQLVVR